MSALWGRSRREAGVCGSTEGTLGPGVNPSPATGEMQKQARSHHCTPFLTRKSGGVGISDSLGLF